MIHYMTVWVGAAFLLMHVAISGCMVNPVTLEREFNVVSETKEIDIGRATYPEILKQFGFYYNQDLQRYVTDVGQKLVRVCPRQDLEYHFTVLDTEMENAFAMPGGYIYITRGLLVMLNSEAELAGVLGHEIGHIVGRDSAALMSKGMIAQIATLAGVAGAAASSSGTGADLAMATNQLFNSVMLGYSREREYLADEQSVNYMQAAGYDPSQIKAFMQTLSYKSQGPTGVQQYLVTHPYIFDRISYVEAKIKVIAAMQKTMGQLHDREPQPETAKSVLGEKYKARIDGIAYGPREDIRHVKIYTVKTGDTFPGLARRTLGSSAKGRQLAYLNGMPTNAQLIPGATIKILY